MNNNMKSKEVSNFVQNLFKIILEIFFNVYIILERVQPESVTVLIVNNAMSYKGSLQTPR